MSPTTADPTFWAKASRFLIALSALLLVFVLLGVIALTNKTDENTGTLRNQEKVLRRVAEVNEKVDVILTAFCMNPPPERVAVCKKLV